MNKSIEMVNSIPLPPEITPESLNSWNVSNTKWIGPLINGENSTQLLSDFDEYLSSINLLVNNNSASPEIEQNGFIAYL